MAKSRGRAAPSPPRFESLAVGQYFYFGATPDPARVFRKCGSKAAIKPEGGTCRVAHNQFVTPLTPEQVAAHTGKRA